jgi:Tfp pilus assembly protein PilO
VKKKLAALDIRVQIGAVVVLLLIVTFVGRTMLVSPQGKKAKDVQAQIDAVNVQISQRRIELRTSAKPEPIKVADLFKLTKAMPDREDMPGIILTVSEVARQSGIHFDLIEPEPDTATTPAGNYTVRRVHLLFKGDFYALSDFLYRLRNLVVVREGKLEAAGRLFSVQKLTMNVQQDEFPAITAELHVNAYQYGLTGTAAIVTGPDGKPITPASTTPGSTSTTETTTTPASTDGSTSPDGATAAGATP